MLNGEKKNISSHISNSGMGRRPFMWEKNVHLFTQKWRLKYFMAVPLDRSPFSSPTVSSATNGTLKWKGTLSRMDWKGNHWKRSSNDFKVRTPSEWSKYFPNRCFKNTSIKKKILMQINGIGSLWYLHGSFIWLNVTDWLYMQSPYP